MGKKATLSVCILIFISMSVVAPQIESESTVENTKYIRVFRDDNITPVMELNKSEVVPIGDQVLFQSFYWDMPDHGQHWNLVNQLIPELAEVGFDSVWLPPPQKTRFGDTATGGYEPYDYFDLGSYNQCQRVRTRFGTQQQLEALIQNANNYNIGTICDVVINHRVGGKLENNTYVGHETPTNFMNIASGELKMNFSHFWPNAYGEGDNLQYGTFPDISHAHPYVQQELIKWGTWLRDEIGFDGFRFDTANGIGAYMLKYWMQNISNAWGVAEYWMQHPDRTVISDYIDQTNETVNAIDFSIMETMRDMCNLNGAYDLNNLVDAGLVGIRSDKAVTFAVNHDTYRTSDNIQRNRHLAYAYLLTHPGYPAVFVMDYIDLQLRNHIKTLVKVHNEYAKGGLSVLHVDEDLYVAQRNGDPGLIVGINDNPSLWKEAEVTTKWTSTALQDLTGQTKTQYLVDGQGNVTLKVPPNSYAIFSNSTPVADLSNIVSLDTMQTPDIIQETSITLDGELESAWSTPTYLDRAGDGSFTPEDLTHLYTKHDNENLYVGLGYYPFNDWVTEELHYGIALDVRPGGATTDPGVHPLIRWSGGLTVKREPDFMYYFTSQSNTDEYQRDVLNISRYEYHDDSDEWSGEIQLSTDRIISSDLLGFYEIKIPLAELDLQQGTNSIGIKAFSSRKNFSGAKDSIPQDNTIDPSGEETSWLTITNSMQLDYNPPQTTTTQETTSTSASSQESSSSSSSSTSIQGQIAFPLPVVVLATVVLSMYRKKRRYES